MRGIAHAKTALARVGKNSVDALRVARKTILGPVRFAEAREDVLPLHVRAKGQISAANRGREPSDLIADPIRVHQNEVMRAAELPQLHVIPGWNHKGRGTPRSVAQMLQDWSRGLGDALVSVAWPCHAGHVGANPITAIGDPPVD